MLGDSARNPVSARDYLQEERHDSTSTSSSASSASAASHRDATSAGFAALLLQLGKGSRVLPIHLARHTH
jgi:hypothetical protein